jgi:hypothetical protein
LSSVRRTDRFATINLREEISLRSAAIKVLAAAGVLALAVAIPAAATQTVHITSEIKLRNHFPAFHGRITSPNSACEEGRSVKLFKERRSGAKKLLGQTISDADGKWTVLVDPLKSGAYFAVVQKREEGTAGTIFVCDRDKSHVAVVD